ncbi:DUF4253 domain-containing protein [Actinoplanes sp. NPDC024001]|uniref:DUF4253 domain-containing protein n=1 Tax=Actinoplanes sp. NPDC024001 TaxID=3154598 RepID=UPI0033D3EEFE
MFRRKRLGPAPSDEWTPIHDLLWISAVLPQPGQWAALREQHERTGLWPLLLGGLSDRDPDRPWRSGELAPSGVKRTAPADHDPAALLAAWWQECIPDEDEEEEQLAATAPFGDRWPGLAPPGVPQADPAQRAAEIADFVLSSGWLTAPRLGLVPSARGADAPTAAGWSGPVNHEGDTAKFSAVLRSWEERFGARVVGIGFDTLYLSVAAPPADEEHALRVAAEHFGFCPDNVWQGSGSLTEYAKGIIGQPVWVFWWD